MRKHIYMLFVGLIAGQVIGCAVNVHKQRESQALADCFAMMSDHKSVLIADVYACKSIRLQQLGQAGK